jgi:hypothetical protein
MFWWPVKGATTKSVETIHEKYYRSLSLAGNRLSHEGTHCVDTCLTCKYWIGVWGDETERKIRLAENLERIRSFRRAFGEFEQSLPALAEILPVLLTKLYADCQNFAEAEIKLLLETFERTSTAEK